MRLNETVVKVSTLMNEEDEIREAYPERTENFGTELFTRPLARPMARRDRIVMKELVNGERRCITRLRLQLSALAETFATDRQPRWRCVAPLALCADGASERVQSRHTIMQ